ncbi:MAG TPA: cation-translocating P-type ATPase [archaeon]|nr:cation-translocating P-type ATPase [archaeon]
MTDENSQTGISELGTEKTRELARLGLMGLAAFVSYLGVWRYFLPFDLIAIAATLIGGYPIYKETILSLRRKHVNMEVSMTVAIVASLLLGQLTPAVVIAFFVVLAEFIEEYAVDKGRATVVQLEKSVPKRALVRRNGTEAEVNPQTLVPNDVVIVRDGERVPVDGMIVSGTAYVNQASITGEAAATEKFASDRVYAGSVVESGVIEVSTERVGGETVFGKIIKLVEEAEHRRAPIQKISDRLATWLVEFAIGFSIITFLLTRNAISALSVVVVAGACGVAAGTPVAIVATMGKASKSGVIVKGGMYIEEMSRIDTVVIDKTGTLTFGEPVVTELVTMDGCNEQELLFYAALAEKHSTHPIARSILKKAEEMHVASPEHSTFNYLPGKGVTANYNGRNLLAGNTLLMSENGVELPEKIRASLAQFTSLGYTTVLVAHGKEICGVILIEDKVRDESRKAIADLKQMAIKTIMLTGDNESAAKAVGAKVGVDEVYAQLLPEDKVNKIEELVAEGRRVAMVGDGINDAPALAHANVGISMGTGTDVAIEEADIVLMTNDLRKIADIVRMSNGAYRTIMQNFYGTISVDGIGVILAFLGFLNPLLAALIHVASEFTFIMNSAKQIR